MIFGGTHDLLLAKQGLVRPRQADCRARRFHTAPAAPLRCNPPIAVGGIFQPTKPKEKHMEGIIAHIVAGTIYAGAWFAVACMGAALAWGVAELFREAR